MSKLMNLWHLAFLVSMSFGLHIHTDSQFSTNPELEPFPDFGKEENDIMEELMNSNNELSEFSSSEWTKQDAEPEGGKWKMPPSLHEFGWDPAVMVPHAYSLFLQGNLASTQSCGDLSALYWFSPKHSNVKCERRGDVFDHWHGVTRKQLMETDPHKPIPNWQLPPHIDHYAPMPTLPGLLKAETKYSIVLGNKYNKEWSQPPINYMSINLLKWIVKSVADKCANTQVLYARNRMIAKDRSLDDAGSQDLPFDDYETLNNTSNVVFLEDVVKNSSSLSFNEIQMRAFAKHKCFASVHGGFAHLTVQFGEKHILWNKRPGHSYDKFNARLSTLAGDVLTVDDDDKFKEAFTEVFLKNGCQACGLRNKESKLKEEDGKK